ncbi:unnamed protein product, partial [Ilex paraguariensis]
AESGYFTTRLRRGGKFNKWGGKVYVGGKINHFGMCHNDHMSLKELDYNLKSLELGYFDNHKAGNMWMVMENNNDTMQLSNWVNKKSLIDVYVEHRGEDGFSVNHVES